METTKEVIVRAELPKLMRAVREALGLSQEELASRAGVSRQMISYYETADAIPSIETFNKWLGAVTAEIKKLRGGV